MSKKILSMIAAVALIGASIITSATAVYAETEKKDNNAAASHTCPAGSVKAGSSVSSLAECNLSGENNLMPTVSTIINVIIGVVGIVSVIFIVIGGLSYVTSAGDPGKTKKAKDTILYAIIGLIVAVLAFAIVNFVLASAFGATTSA